MSIRLTAAAMFVATMMAACQPTPQQSETSQQPNENAGAESVNAGTKFDKLAEGYFDDGIELNPLMGTFVGRNEYNNRLANTVSPEYLAASKRYYGEYLAQVTALDDAQLAPQQQLSRQILEYEINMAIAAQQFPSELLPLNQFYSKVFTFVQLGSGQSAQPFVTEQDYDNFISRIDDFVEWSNSAKTRMNQGIDANVVLPRTLVERIIPQLSALTEVDLVDSPLYGPLKQLPADLDDDQQAALVQRYEQALNQRLMPALADLQSYFADTYLAASRSSDGWNGLPQGDAWYQYLANLNTTTTMPVSEIHQLGLEEVARILAEMDKVRQQVGFEDDLTAFFDHLSSDPQFFFTEKQQLIDGYSDVRKRIDAVLPKYFDVTPKADYVVKAVEPFREKSAAGASYQSPAPDGSRPGVFYVNTYNLKAQPKWGMTTLSLHEAAPGHHFQIAIKQELQGVPTFQRFGGYTAFEEGWALYAEYLGMEMGLFDDPYQYFGKLSDEMLRAMRLVVDTGLHSKGWSREQAIQYMLDNSPMAESDVTAEVERYMAIPGQALSYKVGQITILMLRERAEVALGDKFDLRQFHNQVLTSGSLPMALLEKKIDRWIAQQS